MGAVRHALKGYSGNLAAGQNDTPLIVVFIYNNIVIKNLQNLLGGELRLCNTRDTRREPRKINGGNLMSKRASQVLQEVKDKAETAANHPAWWSKEGGELVPDLYQIDLALETLESLERATARAKAELELLRPAAREAARLEYQGGVNRA